MIFLSSSQPAVTSAATHTSFHLIFPQLQVSHVVPQSQHLVEQLGSVSHVGELHRDYWSNWGYPPEMKTTVVFKESYTARHGLTFTRNIHTSLHLRTESPFYSGLWSIYLSSYLSLLIPSFILSISLSIRRLLSYLCLLAYFTPVVYPPFSLSLSVFLGFLSPPCCQAGFPAGEASEEEEEEQLQCERNTDSHQGDPQEEGRVVLQTAGVDFLFSSYVKW